MDFYPEWDCPDAIVSDGPYGVGGYEGDPHSAEELADAYLPHVEAWSRFCRQSTVLWFWNTELGWAEVHPVLKACGWRYVCCCIWDKGIGHVAGNVNARTIGHLPVSTEVCVQYVREQTVSAGGKTLPMKEWLRSEWERTGLPLREANFACGVKDAASRKWLAKDWMWYEPPAEAFGRLSAYANLHGRKEGRPYFSLDGLNPAGETEFQARKPKFRCPVGSTNVWSEPHLSGAERLREGTRSLHSNQKPLRLMKGIVEMSTDEGDAVWEPFGGLCTAAVACLELNRMCFAAEIGRNSFSAALNRVRRAALLNGLPADAVQAL